MATVTEIAPDLFKISTFIPWANLEFSQFLLKDEEPLLFHTGLKSLFSSVLEATAGILDPSTLRWIAFSHYEADECAALNDWLSVAPNAEPLCSLVGKIVSVDDVSLRPAKGAVHGEVLRTGRFKVRFLQTPHLPHGWDAGILYEETQATLLCSDLFQQSGDVGPFVGHDELMTRTYDSMAGFQTRPLMNYFPYTPYADRLMAELAELRPTTLATMHGSACKCDGEQALRELAQILKGIYGAPDLQPRYTG